MTAAAWAQVATSRLEGTVLDPSGAVIPRAIIKCLSEATGREVTTITREDGFFAFPSLSPGPYRLIVEATGFRSEVITGLEIRIATTTTVRPSLELGSPAESVTVDALSSDVQVSDAQGGGVISERDIDTLPQVERNPVRLVAFQPGVQVTAGALGISRVNGTRHGSQMVKLDGVDVVDNVAPALGFAGVPTSDAIQEFRVLTHSAKAEYGRVAGAQIEMVSRSGTNRWNGTLYHFHRNTALNANEFFNNSDGVARPKFIYNNFGGTIGGPLRRDRTFFFASYTGIRTRQDVSRNRLVLTREAKAGLFRWRSSDGILSYDIARNDPRGRGIDPMITETLRLLPEPNTLEHPMSDGLNTGGFRFNNPAENRTNIVSARADHTVRESLRLFARYTTYAGVRTTDVINFGDATFPGQPHGLVIPIVRGFSVGSNWTLSPTAILDVRLGQNEINFDVERPARLEGPMIVASAWTNPLNPQFGRQQRSRIVSVAETISVVRGSHTLKAGAEWRSWRLALQNANGIYPSVFLGLDEGNSVPAGVGPPPGTISSEDLQRFGVLYNHLLGRVSRVDQTFYSDLRQFLGAGVPRRRNFRNHEVHAFIQDDWKLRPNFTLNFGLRYEMQGSPSERDGLQATFDKVAEIGPSNQISNLTVTPKRSWYSRDWNNFAPRAAFAWDPKGDGKTALRVSYGIYYDAMIGNVTMFVDQRTPGFSQASSVFPNAEPGSDHRLSDRIVVPVPPGALDLRPANTRDGTAAVIHPYLRTGYLQQYSVSMQREVASNLTVEAAWVGNRGIKLFMQTMPNQLRIDGDFLTAFRELQTYRTHNAPPSPDNTLVRLFGSPQAAVTAIGGANLDQGAAGQAADLVDRIYYSRYPRAGVSDYYLRNFPQYNLLFLGTNDGRSYYDSLQVSLRRKTSAARFDVHYTWSKTIDILGNAGAAQESVIDQFNLRLNRGLSDFDRPHVLAGSAIWMLPFGKGRRLGARWPRWLQSLSGGWDLGGLGIWESGSPFTVRSGRRTIGAPTASFADFTGDRKIGRAERQGDGVYFFSPDEARQFSFPTAGEIGTAGRNTLRGPRFFDVDVSLSKRFRFGERNSLSFRAEAYNVFNNPNFANPSVNLVTPAAFGKISEGVRGLTGAPIGETLGGPRVLQVALRWEFE